MSDWMSIGNKLVDWITRPSTLALLSIRSGVALLGFPSWVTLQSGIFQKLEDGTACWR